MVELLYEVSPRSWLEFAGTKERALRMIRGCYSRAGTDASPEIIRVAELDNRIAGLIAAFPASEIRRRYWRSVLVSLPLLPLRRWPGAIVEARRELATAPTLPGPALYVDSLVTTAEFRRRGVAKVLLSAAGQQAHSLGLPALALDTDLHNEPAQRLYESFGFVESGRRPPAKKRSGIVYYVKDLTPRAP